jgi:hypothetical protein
MRGTKWGPRHPLPVHGPVHAGGAVTEPLFPLTVGYERGTIDATPAAVALALACIPRSHSRLRAIVSGRVHLATRLRAIPKTIAILRKIPGLDVWDRRGGNGRRILVLRARCIIHEGHCQESAEMAAVCAEAEYRRDPEWAAKQKAAGRRLKAPTAVDLPRRERSSET